MRYGSVTEEIPPIVSISILQNDSFILNAGTVSGARMQIRSRFRNRRLDFCGAPSSASEPLEQATSPVSVSVRKLLQ